MSQFATSNFVVMGVRGKSSCTTKWCVVVQLNGVGKLQFVSDTDGANYYYSLNVADAKTEKILVERSSVDLSACYDIACYARADGYTQSETAKATLYWLNAEGGDDTDNINLVKTRGVMVTTDNDITISGLMMER